MAKKACASSALTECTRNFSTGHLEPIECLKLSPKKSILKSLTSPLKELSDTEDNAATSMTKTAITTMQNEGKFRKIASAPHFDEMNIRATHHHHHHHHHLQRQRRQQMEKLGRGRILSLHEPIDVVPSNIDEMAKKSDENLDQFRHHSDKDTVDTALNRSEEDDHDQDVCWDDDESSSSSCSGDESEHEHSQLHVAKQKEMRESEGLAMKFGKILIDNEAEDEENEIEGDKD